MVATELGACEWFVWDIRRSNLIDRGQLDQIVGEFMGKNPRAEPPSLAEYLVSRGILTEFQAERLLQGKTQGFVMGPFTLMDALGTGSMGTVYKAQSKTDNNWYAVKVLPRRSMWNVRLARRKVRSFENVRQPSVVPFVDVGTAGGLHYLAWPLVEGETLDKLVERSGRLQTERAAKIAYDIAEGLHAAQKETLFHGLIKPSNIMLGLTGETYILDFGIGCLLAETEGESLVDTMSTSNSVTSGLDCASPESIMDPTNLTPTGDQYSLGCVLYYMLTGHYPFPDGTVAEKMMAHQFQQPAKLSDLVPGIPGDLIAVVERLMQKQPEERYGTASEVAEALRPFAGVVSTKSSRRLPTIQPEAVRPTLPNAGAPRPTVSPSSLTPKPQAIGNLPSRDAIRRPTTVAKLSNPEVPTLSNPAFESPNFSRPKTMSSLSSPGFQRPKTMMGLPGPANPPPRPVTRQNLAVPQPIAPIEPEENRTIPGNFEADEPDNRLGILGVFATAALACIAVYWTATYLGLF